jgi:hypothetical protein
MICIKIAFTCVITKMGFCVCFYKIFNVFKTIFVSVVILFLSFFGGVF